MADIDIFSLQPSVISRDLKGKYILLYGAPKVGKTSFAVQAPRALVCAFEKGTNALSNVKAQPISKWVDFKKILSQLRQPRAKEIYDTVVIDTVSIAFSLCEKYICQREGVGNIRDVSWGQGWTMLKNEFQESFREITMLGFGIIFIAHEKNKATNLVDENGDAISAVAPDIPQAAYTIVNGIVDIIGYISVEDFDENTQLGKRYLYTRQTPRIFAGSRYKYLEPKIPFGYDELVNAIGDALEKDAKFNGARIVDHEDNHGDTTRLFSDVMDETRNLFMKLSEGDAVDTNMEKVSKIIARYFGSPDFRLSETKESQQDLLEAVLEEMKQI